MSICSNQHKMLGVSKEVINSVVQKILGPTVTVAEFHIDSDKQELVSNASLLWIKTKLQEEKEGPSFILKKLPNEPERIKSVNESHLFSKEILVYEQILLEFEVFQSEHGIEQEDIFNPGPKYYLGKTNGKDDFLAIEDLNRYSYKTSNSSGGLNFQEALLVVKTLAKFHAMSYAKFSGDGKTIMERYPLLQEFIYTLENAARHKRSCEAYFHHAARLLENCGKETEAQILKSFLQENYYEKFRKFLSPNVRHAVILHGDMFKENILFQESNDCNDPVQVKFIDFQHAGVGSRAIDLTFFLYTCTSIPVLNDKEQELLKSYFEKFQETLNNLGKSKLVSIETFENFLQEYEDYRYYGIFMGILYAPVSDRIKNEMIERESEALSPEERSSNLFSKLSGDERTSLRLENLIRMHFPKLKQGEDKIV